MFKIFEVFTLLTEKHSLHAQFHLTNNLKLVVITVTICVALSLTQNHTPYPNLDPNANTITQKN